MHVSVAVDGATEISKIVHHFNSSLLFKENIMMIVSVRDHLHQAKISGIEAGYCVHTWLQRC